MSKAKLLVEALHPDRYRSLWTADLPWHPRAEVMHQGTAWHAAGLVTTEEQRQAVAAAFDALYPEGRRMTDVRSWETLDPDVAVVEWRDEGTTVDGHAFANGGGMIVEFEGDQVRRLRNFTNTALLQAVEAGWHRRLPIHVLLDVPAYHTIGLPTLSTRPYAPSRTAAVRTSPPRAFGDPLTNEERVHRRFDARKLFKDIPAEHHYQMSPEGYVEFQGTSWHMAGRNQRSVLSSHPGAGEEVFAGVFVPETFGFSHLATWGVADDRWVIIEWVSESELRRGGQFRNHGMTFLHFDDQDRVSEHREYTNVAYLEAVQDDLPGHVSEAAFGAFVCAGTWGSEPTAWSPLPIPAEAEDPSHRSHARATA